MRQYLELYDINAQIRSLVDEETGEIVPDGYELFESLQMDRTQKCEELAILYKEAMATQQALADEMERLRARKDSAKRTADSIKRFLADELDGEKLSTARVALSWRRSSSIQITDENALAEACKQHGIYDECFPEKPREVSKTAIKEKLSDGMELPGAEFVTTNNIQIK